MENRRQLSLETLWATKVFFQHWRLNRWVSTGKVELTESCWLWKGATNKEGYGLVGWGGNTRTVHRAVWEICYGPIPDGIHVAHACDVRNCVHPDHLWLATRKENMQDASRKGRLVRKAIIQ